MIDFRSAPEPMTARQRVLVADAAVIVLATRIWGLARSPWDWDEMLFSLGMRDFNVALHHPHPPGFPLFIGAAKLLRFAGLDDFHALQALNVLAAALIVPAMFLFCRELRIRFSTSLSAAVIFAFFPNVWFFGETAFSDVVAVVLVVLASAFLLRGARSNVSLLTGAILLGISAGLRPQNLVIGFVPFVIAAWSQFRARRAIPVVAAAFACVLIVAGSYWAAAMSTGSWEKFAETLRAHQEYITTVDSFRSAIRPPLSRVSDDFFVRPYRAPLINYAICFFAAISAITALVRMRWSVLLAVASFAPFAISAWLILDFLSASRFSIGYAPMIAILAADGIATAARRPAIEATVAALLTFAMMYWTAPAVRLAHVQNSPPVQAVEWIRANVDKRAVLYVHRRMRPFAEYFLPDYRLEWATEPAIIAPSHRSAYYFKEGNSSIPQTRLFSWPRDPLWNLVRRRYFDVSVVPLTGIRFGDGWYAEESVDGDSWRWMGKRGAIDLPPTNNAAKLRLKFFVPRGATVIVRLNDRILDTIEVESASVDREYPVTPRADVPNQLVIETSVTVNPRAARLGNDSRDLGARLDEIQWIVIDPP